MELNDEDHVSFNDNKDNDDSSNDSIVCLPLAQRMRLKNKNFADQSHNENVLRTEQDECKQNTEEDALDAFNTWLSQKYEKENNSTVSSTGIKVKKHTKNKLKIDQDSAKTDDKCNNIFHSVNNLHQGRQLDEKHKKQKDIEASKNDLLVNDPESPTFPKIRSSISSRKSKRKTAVSGHKRRHVDIDDDGQKLKCCSDDQVNDEPHHSKRFISKRIQIPADPEDDIIEVCSTIAEGSNRRSRRSREQATSRRRRANGSKPHSLPLPSTPGGTVGRPASPATIVLVKQLEDDEMMARLLQEEFDAEQIANSLPMAQGPPVLPSFEPQPVHRPRANNRHSQRYPMLHHPYRSSGAAWSPVDYNVGSPLDELYSMQPAFQNYINYISMMNTPTPPRPRGRGRRWNAHIPWINLEGFDEQDNGNNYETLMALAERLGPAIEKGLSALEISQLPTFLYTPDCKIHNKCCSICMADYETGDNLRKLPCFHDYHDTCIDQWLVKNPACPICRVEVQI